MFVRGRGILSPDNIKEKLLGFIPHQQQNDLALQLDWASSHWKTAGLRCSMSDKDLTAKKQRLLQRLRNTPDPSTFLGEIKALLEQPSVATNNCLSGPTFYQSLLQELETLGWHHVSWVNENLTSIELLFNDRKGRGHTLLVQLPSDFPAQLPVCVADLPKPLSLEWDQIPVSRSGYLIEITRQFQKELDKYQDLWMVLDDLDNNTWVVEPERPTRGSISRKIVVAVHVFLQLELNLVEPRSLPRYNFVGLEAAVVPLQQHFRAHIAEWDPNLLPRLNLERLLGIRLPASEAASRDVFPIECGICYTYNVDGYIPDVVCAEPRCAKCFHQICLYEWLRPLPTTRQSFDILFGSCPYCGHQIMVQQISRRVAPNAIHSTSGSDS